MTRMHANILEITIEHYELAKYVNNNKNQLIYKKHFPSHND